MLPFRLYRGHKTTPERGFTAVLRYQKFLLLVKEGKLFIQLLSLKCLQLKVSSIFRGGMFSSPEVCMYTDAYTHAYISIISKGIQFNTIRKHCTIPSTPGYLCILTPTTLISYSAPYILSSSCILNTFVYMLVTQALCILFLILGMLVPRTFT